MKDLELLENFIEEQYYFLDNKFIDEEFKKSVYNSFIFQFYRLKYHTVKMIEVILKKIL